MIILGLTGSIGMGKSTAAIILEQLGCPVHSSDTAVHDLMKPGGDSFEMIAVTFQEAWDKKKHRINRDILGQIVFNDPSKLQELENILHPAVQRKQLEFIRKQTLMGRKMVALDIPLLFETNADKRVDYTLVVTAPEFIQKQRVLSRSGMTEQRFEKIKATQMSDVEKRGRADFIVPTGLGLAYTREVLRKILRKLCH